MLEYDDTGDLTDKAQLVQRKGFTVNAHVQRQQDKRAGQITKITQSTVSLKDADKGDIFTVNLNEFIEGSWAKYTPKEVSAEMEWASMSHGQSSQMKLELAKAKVLLAIDRLVGEQGKNWNASCALYAKPRRVKAKKDLKPEELCLVPTSLSLGAIRADNIHKITKVPKTSILLDPAQAKLKENSIDDVIIVINATHLVPRDDTADDGKNDKRESFVAPFWQVFPTEDPKLANMSVSYTSSTQKGIAIPCFTNHVEVKAGQELKILESNWPRLNVIKRLRPDAPSADAEDDAKKKVKA